MSDGDEKYSYLESQQRARMGHFYDPVKDDYLGYKSGLPEGQNPGCFPGSVTISTPDGGKRIDVVKPGQIVIAYDRNRRKLVESVVKKVLVHRAESIYEVIYQNGKEPLRVTRNHTVLTQRGWKTVESLRSTDVLLIVHDNEPMQTRVVDINNTLEKEPVYNLITKGEHTFIAGGVIVHNFTVLRTVRTMAYRLYDFAEDMIFDSRVFQSLRAVR